MGRLDDIIARNERDEGGPAPRWMRDRDPRLMALAIVAGILVLSIAIYLVAG